MMQQLMVLLALLVQMMLRLLQPLQLLLELLLQLPLGMSRREQHHGGVDCHGRYCSRCQRLRYCRSTVRTSSARRCTIMETALITAAAASYRWV
jgi:hypothetical protein